jgi:hypothetical protein
MDALAAEYAERGFDSLFIYTREAHPGEILPHHTSFAQKLRCAALPTEQGVRRRILVDALDGAAISCNGAAQHDVDFAAWPAGDRVQGSLTDAEDVRMAMRTTRIAELQRRGGRAFWTERLGYRVVVGRPSTPG